MLRRIVKLTQASCYVASQTLGYDATDPVVDLNTKNCIWNHCTANGGSMACGTSMTHQCSQMYACGYSGAASADPCAAGALVSQSVDEKRYRISKVEAFNNDNGTVAVADGNF